jgi:hypothetical protein
MALLLSGFSGFVHGCGQFKNSFKIGKGEYPPLPVAGHFRIFARSEAPANGVGIETQQRAQVTCPVAILVWNSKAV